MYMYMYLVYMTLYIYMYMYITFTVPYMYFPPVPSASVSGLKVQRLKDNDKILVVSWEAASLTPPVGPVALYEVQYRDAQQAVSNKAHVQPPSSSLVLRDVANANDYEVSWWCRCKYFCIAFECVYVYMSVLSYFAYTCTCTCTCSCMKQLHAGIHLVN